MFYYSLNESKVHRCHWLTKLDNTKESFAPFSDWIFDSLYSQLGNKNLMKLFDGIPTNKLRRRKSSHALAEPAIDLCVHVIHRIGFLLLCIIVRLIIFQLRLNALLKLHEMKMKENVVIDIKVSFRRLCSLPGNCSFIFSIFMTISAPSFSRGFALTVTSM